MMRQVRHAADEPGNQAGVFDVEADLVADGDAQAVAQLTKLFAASNPVAIVTDRGRVRSDRVIRKFLGTTGENVTRLVLDRPCESARELLTTIVSGIGFQTKDFAVRDLESILRMFLSFQRTHRRRTIIWSQDAHKHAPEALGKIYEYVDLEAGERYGLFFILAGAPELAAASGSNILDALVERSGAPIRIAPLAEEQAREFVMRQIEAREFADATLVIDSEALARLYEYSEGVCDHLSGLCDLSLQLASDASEFPITANLVSRAAGELGLDGVRDGGAAGEPDADDDTVAADFFGPHTAGRLVVRRAGKLLCEFILDRDVVTIGRDKHNVLAIPSLYVSRHHALLTTGEAGVLLQDLGSTNGTVVNGQRIETQVLEGGDAIVLGDCRIEYLAPASVADQLVAAEILGLGDAQDSRTGTHDR